MQSQKKRVGLVLFLIVLLILAIAEILPSWNGMWNGFGQNLYLFFHK